MSKCFTIKCGSQPLRVSVSLDEYAHGGMAVQLVDELDGEIYATVSVYVRGVRLAPDEFVFKTYSENEGLLESMLAAGIVEDTERCVDLGFAGPQPICRLLQR